MKKRVMKILLLAVFVVSVFLGTTVYVEAATRTETVGNVTFTYETSETGTTITDISISDTVTEPVEVLIPSQLGGKTVIAMNPISSTAAEKINSVCFEGNIPVIYGNLYQWKYEKNVSLNELGIESNGSYGYDGTICVPDTKKVLANIPEFVTNNYNYDSNNDGINDTYYAGENLVRVDTNYSGDLVVKDDTVSILAGAMQGCKNIGAVTIPDSVEWIGVSAFADSSVTSVNLPSGLLRKGSTIQMSTFYNCTRLKTVTFPDGTNTLNQIGYQAFYNCSSLEGFDFNRVKSLNTLSFAKAFKPDTEITLSQDISNNALVFSHSGVGKVTFGNNVTTIPFESFRNCTSLTEIVWGGVTQVNAWAFSGCNSLTTDVLASSSLTYINHRAFADTGMTEITIPETITDIAGGAFAGNEQLTTLNWKSSTISNNKLFAILNDCYNTKYNATPYAKPEAKDSWAEYTCPTTLNIYAVPSSQAQLFAEQPYLETVNFYCDIESITDNMFQFSPSLKTITFKSPEKVTSIGNNAFMGCFLLKSIPFEKMTELVSIGMNAFMLTPNAEFSTSSSGGIVTQAQYDNLSETKKAYGLTSVDLSNCTKLTTIGTAAFYNQYNVKSAHIPENVTSMYSSFHGTVSMTELVVDCDVNTQLIANNFITVSSDISNNGYNSNLEKVTLNGDISIEENNNYSMFYRMGALKEAHIGKATKIPDNCFHKCETLETVTFSKPELVTSIGNNAFQGCILLKSFPFEKMTELVSIGTSAFMLTPNAEFSTSSSGGIVTQAQYDNLSETKKAYGLTSVDLSNCTKLTTIGTAAFYNQYNVKSAHIPENVTSMYSSFHGTVSMTDLVVDCDVNTQLIANNFITVSSDISNNGYNSNLEKVTLNGDISIAENNDYSMFYRMGALKEVNLTTATVIPQKCFMGCASLEKVNIPKLSQVEDYAFYQSGLKESRVFADVEYGRNVFAECKKLEKVIVEEGVTELGDFMFEGTSALKQVAIPSTLKKINWAAFKSSAGCMIDIPASVEVIEDDAFSGTNAFELIFRGSVKVELTHESTSGASRSVNVVPISSESIIYYVTDAGKMAAEVYIKSLGDEKSAPTMKSIIDPAPELVITGAPEKVLVGEELDLSDLVVMYDGKVLTSDQYELDYASTDLTLGNRVVTVKLLETSLVPEALESNIVSVLNFKAETGYGKVYSIVDANNVKATFTVVVEDVFSETEMEDNKTSVENTDKDNIDNNDSYAEGEKEVNTEVVNTEVVNTNDTSDIVLWIVVMCVCVTAIVSALRKNIG